MNIGTTIKQLRKEKGMNQTEFGNKVDITQATLSQIESGQTVPHKTTLKRICEVLEVPQELLYMMSVEENNIPKEKRELYSIAKDLMLKVFYKDENESLEA
jgi:transcriptional regulator with XRE-family HTH domain